MNTTMNAKRRAGGGMNEEGAVVRRRRFAALGIGLLLLPPLAGCMTTRISMEESPTVSESRAMRDLGVDYLGSGRTALAIRQLQASLELDPEDPLAHLWLGEAYRRKGHTVKTEVFLLRAIELAQEQRNHNVEQEARLNLSAFLSQTGRYEDSLEHCQALAADPTVPMPWRPLTNCGWALMQLGRFDEARASFSDALDFFPRFGPALLNLGILEAKQGHRLAAIQRLEAALEGRLAASGKAEANYRLGELYVALGRRDKAVGHFRAAAESSPNLEWGSQSQAYLDLLR